MKQPFSSMNSEKSASALEREKVILDSDMVESFDDGIAMMMLAQSPNVELLGVTLTYGNTWVAEGTAYAIRQLEAIGCTGVPVLQGMDAPIEKGRIEHLMQEQKEGVYVGAARRHKPEFWEAFYEQQYGQKPSMVPLTMSAMDFIIREVKKHPNEVTILSIGPCMNLALAIEKAPEIVPLIRKVVFMGGSFFNTNPGQQEKEFNWRTDATAVSEVLHSAIKDKWIVGLDVCNKIVFSDAHYERLMSMITNPIVKEMLERLFKTRYDKKTHPVRYVWDVVAASVVIDPSLIVDSVSRYVDVETKPGRDYGKSMVLERDSSSDIQQAKIVLSVDEMQLWRLIEEYCKKF